MAALALIFALLTSAPAFAKTKDVDIKAHDGFVLKAVYQKPPTGGHVLVMLHGWKSVKEEWEPLMKALEKNGWGYLAYDSRQDGPRTQFVDDVGAVLLFLQEVGVDRKRISLAGASLGANVALSYASLTHFSGAVVALSPGLDYQGLVTKPFVPRLSAPFLLVASPADQYAHKSIKELAKLNENAELWDDVKAGHGVQMFDENFLSRLVSWLNAH